MDSSLDEGTGLRLDDGLLLLGAVLLLGGGCLAVERGALALAGLLLLLLWRVLLLWLLLVSAALDREEDLLVLGIVGHAGTLGLRLGARARRVLVELDSL